MRLSLDWDQTFTLDPVFWNKFILAAFAAGHDVICVSMRRTLGDIDFPGQVVLTGGIAKAAFCKALGIHVDVWIDDQPGRIVEDANRG